MPIPLRIFEADSELGGNLLAIESPVTNLGIGNQYGNPRSSIRQSQSPSSKRQRVLSEASTRPA
jgi:hypothetical protein